jgi:uroporphyrinogen decarboxylase
MSFNGLRVVSFESRRNRQMADLIARRGGEAIVAPSMREVPLEENPEPFAFAEKLLAGQIDLVIFLTGTGARTLFDVLKTHGPLREILATLAQKKIIARGPKTAELLKELGLNPTVSLTEPNTSREILAAVDAMGTLEGQTVAVQEYGSTPKGLIEGLVQRGAKVVRVPVYRWALPEDTGPLREALRAVAEGKADIVLFTNSNQISHVLQLAQEEGIEKEFREGLRRMVVASVGPVCSEYLDEYGVPVDLQPELPKMDSLVEEASARGAGLLEQKRDPSIVGAGHRPRPQLDDISGRHGGLPLHDQSPFMKACRREATPYTPIWLMRQAGRYMKEYREIRDRHSFLDLCKDSDLATEVTVYAVERLGVDAAIIFSDILLILEPMGLSLEYAKGDGPVIHNPVHSAADIDRLVIARSGTLGFVYEAIGKTRRALPAGIPLIGFSGAPFTLASYMIEGGGSRNYIRTKSLMYQDPDVWNRLMKKIVGSLAGYLNAQIAAGAQAVQLFDSWVGCLSPHDYKTYVQSHVRDLIQRITPGTPVIHFGTQTGPLLELMRDAGGQVIGLDWRVELDAAWNRLGDVAVQGNLDPTVLFAEPGEIRKQAKRILDQAAGKPGHIFNLGHGVLPNTPVGHVKALVDAVHEMSERKASPSPSPLP